MFLTKDNTLKWKWILFGALITLVLVFAGVFGADKIMHALLHSENCIGPSWNYGDGDVFCLAAKLISVVFSAKMWLMFSALSVFVFFMYKAFTNEYDFRYAFIKIKNSYVFYVFASVLLATMTTGVLKVLIGRARPILYEALGKTMFVPGSLEYTFNSMPSGHAAASFAGLVMIGMLFPRIKWATWTMAIVVGLSRVYMGAHWTTDVIFGAFIGMLCADIVKYTLKRINSK